MLIAERLKIMPDQFTITDYLTHLEVELGLSSNTIEAYLHNVNRYISYLSSQDINNPEHVEKSTVVDFIEHLRSIGLSANSVARFLNSLKKSGLTSE